MRTVQVINKYLVNILEVEKLRLPVSSEKELVYHNEWLMYFILSFNYSWESSDWAVHVCRRMSLVTYSYVRILFIYFIY